MVLDLCGNGAINNIFGQLWSAPGHGNKKKKAFVVTGGFSLHGISGELPDRQPVLFLELFLLPQPSCP